MQPMTPSLGVCYYPEHWSEDIWAEDARRMVESGLSVVRIGEFAWSRMQPLAAEYEWGWLDQAVQTLGEAGLDIVLCTPTATPPRWMLDRYPDMLAVDKDSRPRKFGSRRHYCFSHLAYREESAKVASLMARRYGKNDYICAWQIDNEYGCHDSVLSYSQAAREAFVLWLEDRYGSIEQLNQAWGNVFWSMEYNQFSQIDLPNLTVTETNPAHDLDFRRFSSDQVVAYNRMQVDAIQAHSDLPLIHNYMGRITDFDHFKLGKDLQIASWDSYPLGFLEDRVGADDEWKLRFYRQGDPDFQAFHHDLYRAVGNGRWWVMEQQPGPVNWAPDNPAPLPGMVRLWSWEAIAHQAEAVCYFRWRQAPFAQEQMHAGLLRPDSQYAKVQAEVLQLASELNDIGKMQAGLSDVAFIFDYESNWAWQTQAQGSSFDYFGLCLSLYGGLRRLGLSVDILPASASNVGAYKLVLVPALMHWENTIHQALNGYSGTVLIGPRSGSKTKDFSIPPQLPPAIDDFDCKVTYVESLREGAIRELKHGGYVHTWLESIESNETVLEETVDGDPVLLVKNGLHYLGGWPDSNALERIIQNVCDTAGIETKKMPEGVRQRCTASHRFVFNHNAQAVEFEGRDLPAAGVRWEQR